MSLPEVGNKSEKFDLIAIGDVAIDEFIQIHDASVQCDLNQENCQLCLDYGGKIPVDSFSTSIAGNAANVVIGASKKDLRTAIYTEFGKDLNGSRFIEAFKENDVSVCFCSQNENAPTNVHQIISFQGERTILSYHHPFEYKLPEWHDCKIVFYTSMGPGFEKFQAELASYLKEKRDTIVAFNPGTLQMKAGVDALRNIFEMTDILFVNKEEAERLTGISSPKNIKDLHVGLLSLGIKLSIVTNGEKGSTAYDGTEYHKLGSYKPEDHKVVDMTGAGDAYNSGFLAAIAHGKDTITAMRWGAINASSIVSVVGSINGQMTKQELEELSEKSENFWDFEE